MERELEKTLLEIESSIKDHERRGNTHTQSVLEQARDIVAMCAQAARTPSELKEILERKAYNEGWTPVEERLPDEDGFYIATMDGGIVGQEETFVGLAELENGLWVDDDIDYKCIIAWRPLPDPYRPVDKTEAPPNWREDMLRKFNRRD